MKIIIVGAGRVGSSVAEALVSEANDITVIDTDVNRVAELQDRFDLRGLVGNAALPSTLHQAGADDADMLIAVTAGDEINLVACKIAADLYNIPTRIARVRNVELQQHPTLIGEGGFRASHVIFPEQTVTDYLLKLIEFPEALQVLEFAEGGASLIAVRAFAGGPLVSHPIKDLRRHIPKVDARIGRPGAPDGKVHNYTVRLTRDDLQVRTHERVPNPSVDQRLADIAVSRLMIDEGPNPLELKVSLGPTEPAEGDRYIQEIRLEIPARHLVLEEDGTDQVGSMAVAVVAADPNGSPLPARLLQLTVRLPTARVTATTVAAARLRLMVEQTSSQVAVAVRDQRSGTEASALVQTRGDVGDSTPCFLILLWPAPHTRTVSCHDITKVCDRH